MENFLSIRLAQSNELGFASLEKAQGAEPLGSYDNLAKPVAVFVHLSDTHICDSESPIRMSFADHYADPHNPLSRYVPEPLGAYRPNEMLTAQVFSAMLASINKMGAGPFSGRNIDGVVITGDLTDNAQSNELSWAKALLAGESVAAASGGAKYQGPSAWLNNPNYWHPDGEPNNPSDRYGYPKVPGLLEAAGQSFRSPGLDCEVHLVHGNHDLLAIGSIAYDSELTNLAISSKAAAGFVSDQAALESAKSIAPVGPASWPSQEKLVWRDSEPDAARAPTGDMGWNGTSERYFATMIGQALLICLDTVNPHGGYEGSIDLAQLAWLETLLRENPKTPTLIAAHHPIDKLINTYSPRNDRVSNQELTDLLCQHSQVIAYFAGHDHAHQVEKTRDRFWHIETGSLIDWPQEGRLVELLETSDEYIVCLNVFAHAGTVNPLGQGSDYDLGNLDDLAGIARQLAANNWQRRSGEHSVHSLAGMPEDRNVILRLSKKR